jgi:hypothetical protein
MIMPWHLSLSLSFSRGYQIPTGRRPVLCGLSSWGNAITHAKGKDARLSDLVSTNPNCPKVNEALLLVEILTNVCFLTNETMVCRHFLRSSGCPTLFVG